MNRCPITYDDSESGKYSRRGLTLLSKKLGELHDFPYSPKEQVQLAAEMATKLSIQGVQPKLSVRLNIAKGIFEVVEKKGGYIIKPPHQLYEELPQNEDLTMRLAAMVGIEVPLHGMIYNLDGSLSYFIKRFDRWGKNKKVAIEDFSQLMSYSRETKYESSMEQVAAVIEKHCTFPSIEKLKLFRLTLFNFLVGNEDMHLKNFSLIRHVDKVTLSPAYDLLNTTIVLKTTEDIALPIRGRKSQLTRSDLVDYFGYERLKLTENVVNAEYSRFANTIQDWLNLIDDSFLSPKMRDSYKELIKNRWQRAGKMSRKP